MTRSIFLAAAAFAVLAGAARADERMTISTKGYDLDTAAGAKAFVGHLRREATAACGGAPTYALVTEQPRFDACRKALMDAAVAKIDAPQLTALYTGKSAATELAAK